MADSTCLNCKHWDEEIAGSEGYTRKQDSRFTRVGWCEITRGCDFEPAHKGTKAFCIGPRDENVILCTDDDFSCSQFAEKPEFPNRG